MEYNPLKAAFIKAFLRRIEKAGYQALQSPEFDGAWSIRLGSIAICTLDGSGVLWPASQSAEGKEQVQRLTAIRERVLEPYSLFSHAPPLHVCDIPDYRILSEFSGVVLAGMVKPDGDMKFTTFQYRFDRTGVRGGIDYGNNFEGAKLGFVYRAGLIPNMQLLNAQEIHALQSACAYCLDQDTTPPAKEELEVMDIWLCKSGARAGSALRVRHGPAEQER